MKHPVRESGDSFPTSAVSFEKVYEQYLARFVTCCCVKMQIHQIKKLKTKLKQLLFKKKSII